MRVLDRVVALALAITLAGAGAVLAVEAALLAAGEDAWIIPRRSWDAWLADLAWDDTGLRITAGATVAIGAVVMLLQVVPRRPRRLAMTSGPGREIWITREGVQRRVARAVIDAHDEVEAARVRTGRRRINIRSTVVATSDATTPTRVHATAAAAVTALGLTRPPKLRVRLARTGTRVR